MEKSKLHIVCLDIPEPPDYGGAIDMFYKIKALSENGLDIILHCFDYKGKKVDQLTYYCKEIHLYQRKTYLTSFSFSIPYIVSSRINQQLIKRLNADQHSILLEGFHCLGIYPFLKKDRKISVRVHNNEAKYYSLLAKTETNIFKKTYYQFESNLLKRWQKNLPVSTNYLFISREDGLDITGQTTNKNIMFVPAFVPWQTIASKEGLGEYCLYHGNMSIRENRTACEWLIKKVFSRLNTTLIIAGKNIPNDLKATATHFSNIKFIEPENNNEMDALIRNAQINVLPSFNSTGIKIKMIHALFEGRFCLTNGAGAKGFINKEGMHIAENEEDFIQKTKELTQTEFIEEHIQRRKLLEVEFNNNKNAQKIIKMLY